MENTDHAAIIETLRRQIEAEQATAAELRRQNDLAEKSLSELQRSRMAEQQRMKLAFNTNDALSGIIPSIEKAFLDIEAINCRLKELERRTEQTQDILLLLLTEKSQHKVAESLEDLEAEVAERKTHREKLLIIHQRSLSALQEQAAYHGLMVPVDLQHKIEAEKQALKDLGETL